MRLVDGTKYKLIYPLAGILCLKNSGKLLKNTIIPNLRDGINKVENLLSGLNLTLRQKMKYFTFDKNEGNGGVRIKPTEFLSGNIAFLNTILGKEEFNGDLCDLCDLYKSCLQMIWHDTGCPWTIERLCEQGQKVSVEK